MRNKTIIRGIIGEISNAFYQEAKNGLSTTDPNWTEQQKTAYLKANNVSKLCVVFDNAVRYQNGIISLLLIENDSQEAQFLKQGDRVSCSFVPGKAGQSSSIVSLKRI